MSSEVVRTNWRSRPRLQNPAEVPFFIFMIVLDVIIIAAILDAASALASCGGSGERSRSRAE